MELTLLKRLGLTTLLLTQMSAYAFNPVQGWYGGLILGPSYQPGVDVLFPTPLFSNVPTSIVPANLTLPVEIEGKLSYSTMGNVGGQIGYRCNQFRVEGEVLYNNNPMSELQFGDLPPINAPKSSSTLRLKGASNMGAFMVNGYYDLFTPNHDGYSVVVPYVGVGVGYSYIQNNIEFYYNNKELPFDDRKVIKRGLAGQGIVGLSYFMDDFTAFAIDFRYFTTQKTNTDIGHVENIIFSNRTQIFSVNLLFNGAFDFG